MQADSDEPCNDLLENDKSKFIPNLLLNFDTGNRTSMKKKSPAVNAATGRSH